MMERCERVSCYFQHNYGSMLQAYASDLLQVCFKELHDLSLNFFSSRGISFRHSS